MIEIPIWHKAFLTIPEAAVYFNICEQKIREMANNDFYDCAIKNGVKIIINKQKLEDTLEDCLEI